MLEGKAMLVVSEVKDNGAGHLSRPAAECLRSLRSIQPRDPPRRHPRLRDRSAGLSEEIEDIRQLLMMTDDPCGARRPFAARLHGAVQEVPDQSTYKANRIGVDPQGQRSRHLSRPAAECLRSLRSIQQNDRGKRGWRRGGSRGREIDRRITWRNGVGDESRPRRWQRIHASDAYRHWSAGAWGWGGARGLMRSEAQAHQTV